MKEKREQIVMCLMFVMMMTPELSFETATYADETSFSRTQSFEEACMVTNWEPEIQNLTICCECYSQPYHEVTFNCGVCAPGCLLSYDSGMGTVICETLSSSLPRGQYLEQVSPGGMCAVYSWSPDTGVLKARCLPTSVGSEFYDSTLEYKTLCKPGSTVYNASGFLACKTYKDSVPKGPYTYMCGITSWDPTTSVIEAICSYDASDDRKSVKFNVGQNCVAGSSLAFSKQGFLFCPPSGAYDKTCDVQSWNPTTGVLKASCLSLRGIALDTTLDYKSACIPGSEVENDDGKLICAGCPGMDPKCVAFENDCKTCTACATGFGLNTTNNNCVACGETLQVCSSARLVPGCPCLPV